MLGKAAFGASQAVRAFATVSDVRWATVVTIVWARLDGLVYVSAILDRADREYIGLNVSQRNDAREADWALDHALIRRFGAELYRSLAKPYGLPQECILPHTHEQNGVA